MSSFTECQMMSARASPSTRESTVSTDRAWACTIKGALRRADGKLSYLTLTRVR
ncbi:hypothetical protein D3C73_1251730 [compost metagenome]